MPPKVEVELAERNWRIPTDGGVRQPPNWSTKWRIMESPLRTPCEISVTANPPRPDTTIGLTVAAAHDKHYPHHIVALFLSVRASYAMLQPQVQYRYPVYRSIIEELERSISAKV
jgi:hypothetical protein